MVEISEPNDLEAWLKGRPREVAIVIAARASLRVLPLTADFARDGLPRWGAALLLPMFRAMAVPRVAGNWPTRGTEMRSAARSAARSADSARSALWAQVELDANAIANGLSPGQLVRTPLWKAPVPKFMSDAWPSLKAGLRSSDQNWQVWTDWYDDILRGTDHPDSRPLIEELEVARVLIPDADWEKGPAHVNALIAELEAKYRAKAPEPEDIEAQDPVAVQFRETDHRIDADDLAGRDAVAVDLFARDLHDGALAFAQDLHELVSVTTAGSNRPRPRAAIVTRLIEATGATVDAARPGLLIPLAAALQVALDADTRRERDPDLEGAPMSAGEREAVANASNAYKTWINTDPYLATLEGARQGKASVFLDATEAAEVVQKAVDEGAATEAAQGAVDAAAGTGAGSRFHASTVLNFMRRGLKIASAAIKSWSPVVRGGLKVLRWLVKNEEKILELLTDHPGLHDVTKRIIAAAKALPLDKS